MNIYLHQAKVIISTEIHLIPDPFSVENQKYLSGLKDTNMIVHYAGVTYCFVQSGAYWLCTSISRNENLPDKLFFTVSEFYRLIHYDNDRLMMEKL